MTIRPHREDARPSLVVGDSVGSVGVGSVDFNCRPANLIHPATLIRPIASSSLLPPPPTCKDSTPDHIPSSSAGLDPGSSPFLTTPSGQQFNNLFQHDEMLTNPPEEYKNEEDDPFSAVLREMKLKGEFPCRLCEAVFPNLRALKGKISKNKNSSNLYLFRPRLNISYPKHTGKGSDVLCLSSDELYLYHCAISCSNTLCWNWNISDFLSFV
jgi:hypothetical protein